MCKWKPHKLNTFMTGFSIPFFLYQGLCYRGHLWAIHSFVVLLRRCSISSMIARHSLFCQRRLGVKCKSYSVHLRQSNVRAQLGLPKTQHKRGTKEAWEDAKAEGHICTPPLLCPQTASSACHLSQMLKVGVWNRLASWVPRRLQHFCGVPARSQIPNPLMKNVWQTN